jgi:hypothetical protein
MDPPNGIEPRGQKRKASDDGNGVDIDSNRPRKRPKRPLRLACPFHKFDPNNYTNCENFQCDHISEVTTHLRRNPHLRYPCTDCFSAFDSQELLEAHEAEGKQHCKLCFEVFDSVRDFNRHNPSCSTAPRPELAVYKWQKYFRYLFPGVEVPLPCKLYIFL